MIHRVLFVIVMAACAIVAQRPNPGKGISEEHFNVSTAREEQVWRDPPRYGNDRLRQSQREVRLASVPAEGFVNTYLQQGSSDPKKLVFVSEAIENISPGWRARETYSILNENEFIERFELAEPGKEFTLYSEAHLKRNLQP